MTADALERLPAGTSSDLAPATTVKARAAARTAFYAGAMAAAAKLAKIYGDNEHEYGKNALKDAYDLHVKILSRPGMREVMKKAEREDLATLPFFLAQAPFDVARVIGRARAHVKKGAVTPRDGFPYPDYYLNDFHHQVNGNLSTRAALTYEWQIRILFMGCSRLMRQSIIDALPEGDHLDVLDVACGTASWITQARLQNRRHRVTGIDLSPNYLKIAKMFRGKHATFEQMNAESLTPAWSGRFDVVTCIWLFHELPPEASARAAAEMARVLKPGGRLLFMDAAQPADVPQEGQGVVDGISERFRDTMNEPFFRVYQAIDLDRLFRDNGLTIEKTERTYTSRVMVMKKEA